MTILETLADFAQTVKDKDVLTEYVRQALSSTISNLFQSAEGKINALTLDPKIEQIIDETIKQAQSNGREFAIPPDVMSKLYKSISKKAEDVLSQGLTPIIVCSPSVRMFFRKLIESIFPNVIVLSYGELSPKIQIESLGGITLEDED